VAGVGGIAAFFGRAASGDEARGPVEERESAGDGDELEMGLERLEIPLCWMAAWASTV
jgi:hypothetical protein